LNSEPNLDYERDYILTHAARYEHTFNHFLEVFLKLNGKKVLVLGGSSSFERYVAEIFNFTLEVISSDIRNDWQIEAGSVDAIFCFEVIEHLADLQFQDSIQDTFTFSGMKSVLKQSHNALKSNGDLLITTPNSCNIFAIAQLIHGMNPMRYAPHVRELNRIELTNLLIESGFEIERFGTEFSWGNPTKMDPNEIMSFIEKHGGVMGDRGDNMICHAVKLNVTN
jgi:predicted SAM-dependent methyltransferase